MEKSISDLNEHKGGAFIFCVADGSAVIGVVIRENADSWELALPASPAAAGYQDNIRTYLEKSVDGAVMRLMKSNVFSVSLLGENYLRMYKEYLTANRNKLPNLFTDDGWTEISSALNPPKPAASAAAAIEEPSRKSRILEIMQGLDLTGLEGIIIDPDLDIQ